MQSGQTHGPNDTNGIAFLQNLAAAGGCERWCSWPWLRHAPEELCSGDREAGIFCDAMLWPGL